jgi:hypothetical protein
LVSRSDQLEGNPILASCVLRTEGGGEVHQATWGRGRDERGRGMKHAGKEKERKRQEIVFGRRRMGSS